jgi:hypothetical protein
VFVLVAWNGMTHHWHKAMADDRLPSREGLLALPLRAQVAFAARCAWCVLPVVLHSELASEHKDAVRKAITKAEEFAAVEDASKSDPVALADAAAAARAAAAAATTPTVADAAVAASHAAQAAAAATARYDPFVPIRGTNIADDVARAAPVRAAADAEARAARAAAARANPAAAGAMASDYKFLVQQAEANSWTDNTAVPRTRFRASRPKGAPDWARGTRKTET